MVTHYHNLMMWTNTGLLPFRSWGLRLKAGLMDLAGPYSFWDGLGQSPFLSLFHLQRFPGPLTCSSYRSAKPAWPLQSHGLHHSDSNPDGSLFHGQRKYDYTEPTWMDHDNLTLGAVNANLTLPVAFILRPPPPPSNITCSHIPGIRKWHPGGEAITSPVGYDKGLMTASIWVEDAESR